MGKSREKKIKNQTYYFYNDQIDLKYFAAKLLKIDNMIITRLIFIILVMWLLKKLVSIIILIV